MLTVLNLPNFLTLLRLIAIPVFLILLEELRFAEALGLFVAAGLTDALDGAIARLTKTKTTLGAYLDPAADKLLLVSAFIALGFMHEVPRWLVVVVISRDVMIVLGYFFLFMLTQRTMEVDPAVTGKLSTFLQICAVGVVLATLVRPGIVAPGTEDALFYAAGTVTAIAGIQYMYRGLAWLQAQMQPAAPAIRTPGAERAADEVRDRRRA